MQEYERHDEEDEADVTFDSVVVLHHCLPVFTDKNNKNGCKGYEKRVKIGSRRLGASLVHTTNDYLVILVKFDFVSEEFHAKQSENEHADEQKYRERCDFLHCEHDSM